tara:strand:- start:816 stop:1487 length:672 start_codon:yes stop_codon:yes gene_type:complete
MADLLLLGGLSDMSTTIYFQEVVKKHRNRFERVIVVSFPFDKMETLRKAAGFRDIAAEFDEVIDRTQSEDLTVAICSNTYNQAVQFMRHSAKVFRIDQAVVATAKALELSTVYILATSATVGSAYYNSLFLATGIQTIVPSEEDQVEVDRVIYEELCMASFPPNSFDSILRIIRRSEVNVILLGCTELTYFADRLRERGFVVLDSTMIHIQSLEINSAERAGG